MYLNMGMFVSVYVIEC